MSEYSPAALAARIGPMYAEALEAVRPDIHSGLSVRVPVISPAGVADVLDLLSRQPLILAGFQSVLERFATVPSVSKPHWVRDGLARHLIGAPGFVRAVGRGCPGRLSQRSSPSVMPPTLRWAGRSSCSPFSPACLPGHSAGRRSWPQLRQPVEACHTPR